MRAPLLALLICASLSPQEQSWQERVSIRIESPKTSYLVQELIPLRILIGVEQRFLTEHLIQPFRQRLDR